MPEELSLAGLIGADLMLGFGLCTLHMLLLMGTTAVRLGQFFQRPAVRTTAGIAIITFGLYTAFIGLSGRAHQHHGDHSHLSAAIISPVMLTLSL